MSTLIVEVAPAKNLRQSFATWASRHGVKTRSATTFALPLQLIAEVPEDLLLGAKLDDQPYVPTHTF